MERTSIAELGLPVKSASGSRIHMASPTIPISPTEGFGSPRETAHTPPGVLTKVDSRNRNNVRGSGERMHCVSCQRQGRCVCKKCTLSIIGFYALRSNLSLQLDNKKQLELDIDTQYSEQFAIQGRMNDLRARIMLLNGRKEEQKVILSEKRQYLKSLMRDENNCITYINKLKMLVPPNDGQQVAQKTHDFQQRRNRKLEELNNVKDMINNLRKTLCQQCFAIFPIKQFDAQPMANVQDNANEQGRQPWLLIQNENLNIDEGTTFQIREQFISETSRNRLVAGLESSLLNLSLELRSPFAALLHTAQLLSVIAFLYDFFVPTSLSHKKLALNEQWNRSLFDTHWDRMCNCVYGLCHHCGVREQLYFHYPHANLMELFQFIVNGGVPSDGSTLIACGYRYEIEQPSMVDLSNRGFEPGWEMLDENELDC